MVLTYTLAHASKLEHTYILALTVNLVRLVLLVCSPVMAHTYLMVRTRGLVHSPDLVLTFSLVHTVMMVRTISMVLRAANWVF